VPALRAGLATKNKVLRETYEAQRPSSRRMVQDFFARHNYTFAKTLKVIDLDYCIGCDGCENACASRHGTSRLTRHGPTLGVLAFPISCRSCVDHRCLHACGFEALSIDAHGELVVNSKKCVGCAACQSQCPNDVIEMVEVALTVDDFPNPLPNTDANGETNVKGLYLVGEAAGHALIKLSINSGHKAVDHIAERADKRPAPAGGVDVVIVGAGPAGLAAGLACKARGLSYRVLERGTFAMTINNFPRAKLVMAEPAHIPLYGKLWFRDTTKEELVAEWQKIIAETGIKLSSHEEVTGVAAKDGGFSVTTKKGAHAAAYVILATGTRGSPRKIGVAGEAEPRVRYTLTDPGELADQHVLIVGGGDSAVEAAMSVADVEHTTVTISYRKDSFGRIKARNKSRLEEYEKSGKVTVVLSSQVTAIGNGSVDLTIDGGEKRTIINQAVFALLGAEPPTKFFEKVGIEILQPGSEGMAALAAARGTRRFSSKCDHCSGFENQACINACPTGAILEVRPEEVFVDDGVIPGRQVLSELPFLVGLERGGGRRSRFAAAAAIAALLLAAGLGAEVVLRKWFPELSLAYWLGGRRGGPAAVTYKSGSGLGLWLGYIGASMMVFAATYPLNSRLGLVRRIARSRWWLAAHVWAGILGPVLVTYHSSFKLDRWPTGALVGSWLVALSGIFGRYIAAWLRRGAGLVALEHQALTHERDGLIRSWSAVSDDTGLVRLVKRQASLGSPRLIVLPLVLVWHRISTAGHYLLLRWWRLRRGGVTTEVRTQILRNFVHSAAAARRRLFGDAIKDSITFWRRVHLTLTILMFAIAAVHITYGLLYQA
jgi:thioredoxin reductase/NAD-dependent dihydropyrimidine dehydrogenase PreA subunit